MKLLIEKYKNKRKQDTLAKKFKLKYAFVGIGNHSLNNLYPVLNYLKVDLKYIITKSSQNADLITKNYKSTIGTNNIEEVLSDPEINGVFVCANPTQHYSIASKILSAKKHLFIDKPPCYNSQDLQNLIELQNRNNLISVVGLQKRYSPANIKLKSRVGKASSYTLKYQTGAYPEGDALIDLFIHPLDIAVYLFGKGQPVSILKSETSKNCHTYFIHLKHESGTIGAIELSTDYSWTNANEKLTINTSKGLYDSENSNNLTFTNKPKVISGIPLEKIISFKPCNQHIISENNFLPVLQHNQLFTSGFFNEINTFLNLCENNKDSNKSSLTQLIDTYDLIERINNY